MPIGFPAENVYVYDEGLLSELAQAFAAGNSRALALGWSRVVRLPG